MMSNEENDRMSRVYCSYGRLEGTLSGLVILISKGLVTDVKEIRDIIESRLRKEKKEGLFGNS